MSIVNNLYYPAFIGECSKHKGHGWLGCPLCAIEDVESRRKELSEMLNPNDFDIDSFLDYKPNFITMRKIKFDPSLIGKPGIEVRVDGEVPDFIKYYPNQSYPVVVIDKAGFSFAYAKKAEYLTMFRQQRSAEEIAKEVYDKRMAMVKDSAEWFQLTPEYKEHLTALVQSGLDEMKGGEE